MAEYNDSELIVRLNVYTLLEMLNVDYNLKEKKIPIEPYEVHSALNHSLHYINESMYYFALSAFLKYLNSEKEVWVKSLIESLSFVIQEKYAANTTEKSLNILLLLNSLHNLRPLNSEEINTLKTLVNSHSNFEEPIMICVGNKNFKNYHQYYTPAFNYALLLSLSHYL
jgi:hypothetical protein